jgi:Ca-activated chloride channel homolog
VTALYEIVPAAAPGWITPRKYAATHPVAIASTNEIATVRLRYKLPDGEESRLIEKPVPVALLNRATRPVGDMAFAVAVAAFGQKLRSDTKLGGFGYADIERLAGDQTNYWRQEFLQLAELADKRADSSRSGDRTE